MVAHSVLAATNLGACYFEQRLLAETEAMWARGLELKNAVAARYLGLLLEDQGRLDEAEAAYRAGAEGGDEESARRQTALLATKQRPS